MRVALANILPKYSTRQKWRIVLQSIAKFDQALLLTDKRKHGFYD